MTSTAKALFDVELDARYPELRFPHVAGLAAVGQAQRCTQCGEILVGAAHEDEEPSFFEPGARVGGGCEAAPARYGDRRRRAASNARRPGTAARLAPFRRRAAE
jgi:hypothetical protein